MRQVLVFAHQARRGRQERRHVKAERWIDHLFRMRALPLADRRPHIPEDRWVSPQAVPESPSLAPAQRKRMARTALVVKRRTTCTGTAPIATVQAIAALAHQLRTGT